MNNEPLGINPSKYTAHLHPGKFEGETAATEYYHEQSLQGDGETIYNEDDSQADLFYINADESEAFDLPIGHTFLLWEDSNGFAYGKVFATSSEATAFFTNR